MTAPAGFGAKAGWPTVDVKGKVEPKLCAPDELKKAVVQMKGDSRVSVLSRPQLALTDGQSGMFQVLQLVEVPKAPGDSVQTAGASGTEIGIKFDCTPTVSVDGKTIALKLNTLYSALNNGGGISTIQNRSRVSLPCGNSAIVHVGTMTVEERIETRIPALSKNPYLDRLFRTVGVGTVEKDVYQVVTAHIIKDEPSVKAVLYGECIAAPCCKPVVVPQQVFRHRIGWFGGQ